MIIRSPARAGPYEIIRTCLDHPGGLPSLPRALEGFTGGPLALNRLKQAIARLLLDPSTGP